MADPGFGNGGYANLKMMDLYEDSPSGNGVMVASTNGAIAF